MPYVVGLEVNIADVAAEAGLAFDERLARRFGLVSRLKNAVTSVPSSPASAKEPRLHRTLRAE